MAADLVTLKKTACEAIDNSAEELFNLNQEIWKNPELCYKEKHAHDVLTEYLENKGFEVSRRHTLDTAFRAASTKDSSGLTVGVMCEYDALPVVGHACGHNLIAEAAVAAGIAIKAALNLNGGSKLGRVVVLGTPAEEGQGGKIKMIESGCFTDLDFCMMVHPAPKTKDATFPLFLACTHFTAVYKGHSTHAASFPWDGLNALDAAVAAYNNVSMMRQQMKPTWRVHTIITEGGVKCNIIPEKSVIEFMARAPTKTELESLKSKVIGCIEAAATATGCTVNIEMCPPWETYFDVQTNAKLAQLFQLHAEAMGVKYPPKAEQESFAHGSTDLGNVSYVKPSIHPMYAIDTTAVNHSHGFTAAAATKDSHEKTLLMAKAMAFTTLEVLCNPEIMKEIHVEFEKIKNL